MFLVLSHSIIKLPLPPLTLLSRLIYIQFWNWTHISHKIDMYLKSKHYVTIYFL